GRGEPLPLAGVALLEAGVDLDRPDPDGLGDDLGRHPGALQVAGDDGVDGAQVLGRVGGLVAAQVGQRRVGLALPAADRVPLRLPVAGDEAAPHGGDGTARGADSGAAASVAYPARMAQVRLFASVREAAGRARDEVPGATVAEVLDAARARYGSEFDALLQQ